MATYNLYKVTVFTKCSDPIVFDDADNYGEGAAAYAALEAGETINGFGSYDEGDPTRYIIPYASVCFASIEVSKETYEDPEDETCGGSGVEPS